MNLVAVLRYSLLALAGLISLFAVLANVSHLVHEWYEHHVKHWLEIMEVGFIWLDFVYFVLPMVAFISTLNWAAVFFDCFTPVSLWLEALYAAVQLVHILVFIGDPEQNFGRIMVLFAGLSIQLLAIIVYVMQKLALHRFNAAEARYQNISALAFFKISGLVVLIKMQVGGTAPPGQGYWSLALAFALIGILLQLLQASFAIGYRVRQGNFNDDEPNVGRVKLCAALIRVFTQLYDCWLFASRGYWASPERMMLPVMTAFTLFITCILAFCRYMGPSRMKELFDASVHLVKTMPEAIPVPVRNGWRYSVLWLRGELLTNALAEHELRRAAAGTAN